MTRKEDEITLAKIYGWTRDHPSEPGRYWFRPARPDMDARIVCVWKYRNSNDPRLFTNEDGGSLVTDQELYGRGWWSIEPIPEKHFPKRLREI